MRNASGHQGENDHEWEWKKVHRNTYDTDLLHKTRYYEVSGSFTL